MAAAFMAQSQFGDRGCRLAANARDSRIETTDARFRGQLHLQASQQVSLNTQTDKRLESTFPIRTLILDNYDSYTYNLFQLLSVVNGEAPVVVRNDELSFGDVHRLLYKERAFDNVVISPGPGSPASPADIGICMHIFQQCPDIPILGVCMGYQLLGYAYGMRILHAPQPVHGRLSEVEHSGHPLFSGIPSGPSFKVVRYHSLVLDGSSVASELTPTAWTLSEKPIPVGSYQPMSGSTSDSFEALHVFEARQADCPEKFFPCESMKLLMGISHRTRPHHGVQFHPESIATTHGRKLLENFRDITRTFLEDHAVQPLQRKERGTRPLWKQKPTEDNGTVLDVRYKVIRGIEKACGGSSTIFSQIFGAESAENTFWLDSSNIDQGRARFSYMGGKGGPYWLKITYSLQTGTARIENSAGDVRQEPLQSGFFDYLSKETQVHSCRKEQYSDLPFDFIGGFVGYLGYELKCECGAVSNRYKSAVPDAAFFMADRFLAIDHLTGDVYFVALSEAENAKDAQSWVAETSLQVLELEGEEKDFPDLTCSTSAYNVFTPAKDRSEYMTDVHRCQEYIRNGESYEVCLTTQLTKRLHLRDKLGLYQLLRRTNPAPYAAWLDFGRDMPSICCSSPERFLRLDQAGMLEAKPIKGTTPRGHTTREDEELRYRLKHSEKDQAENLMIVDLLRNDLGRVCVPGSVHVPSLMTIESYSTVHTMVSTVRGRKREDKTPVKCVQAAFPGGSMTGAPKIRTMEILDSIESSARGVYSGSIGFFSLNSSFDLNIVIRTLVIHKGEVSIGAGGAVVALSDPESEYEEMLLKTRAPARAVDIFQRMDSL